MIIHKKEALQYLYDGELIIYPTDTVYGLGCLPSNQSAVKKLLAIKPRTGFIVIVDSWSKCTSWIDEPFQTEHLETDKPTTWVFKASKSVPKDIQKNGLVAIRKVKHLPTLRLLEQLDQPLISTSANKPGQKTPSSFTELEAIFSIPILSGEPGNQPPSSLIIYGTKQVLR